MRETNIRRNPGMGIAPAQNSIKSRTFAHEVPIYRGEGESIMKIAESMQGFYRGAGSLVDSLADAEHRVEMARIDRQNREQTARGAADALTGQFDEAAGNDYDYTDAYSKTLGVRKGLEAAEQFAEIVNGLDVSADAEGKRQEFLQQVFGKGTGTELFDAHFMQAFDGASKNAVVGHANKRRAYVRQQGLDNLANAAVKALGAGQIETPEDLHALQSQAEVLHQGDLIAARAWVLNTLLAGANTEAAIDRVTSLLHIPGYGANGESFAQMFPEQGQELLNKLQKSYNSFYSIEAAKVYEKIDEYVDSIRDDPSKGQEFLDAVPQLLDWIAGTKSVYGGRPQGEQAEERVRALRDKLTAGVEKLAQHEAKMGHVRGYMEGRYSVLDRKIAAEVFPYIMAEKGVTDPLADPQQAFRATGVIAQMRYVHPDWLHGIGATYLDAKADPAKRMLAHQIIDSLVNHPDMAGALNLPEDVQQMHAMVKAMSMGGGAQAGLQRLAQNPEAAKFAREFRAENLPEAIGSPRKTPAEARAVVADKVNDALVEATGVKGKLLVSDALRQEFTDKTVRAFAFLKALGHPDALGAATAMVAEEVKRSYLLVPGMNGKSELRRVNLIADPKADRLTPGTHRNPRTGVEEDTTETFRQDLRVLSERLPRLSEDGDDFHVAPIVSTTGEDLTSQTGEFAVYASGVPVVVGAGDLINHQGTPLQLSRNPAEAAAQLKSILPFWINLRPAPHDPSGAAWQLTYRFRFTDAVERVKPARIWQSSDAPGGLMDLEVGSPTGANVAGLNAQLHGGGPTFDATKTEEYRMDHAEYMRRAFRGVITKAQNSGRVSSSAGLTVPLPEVNSAQDLLSNTGRLIEDAARQRGPGFFDRLTGMRAYDDRRRQFIANKEAVRLTAYDDATGKPVSGPWKKKGNVTVGIGFNMERADARDVWKAVGLDDFDAYYKGQKSLTRDQAERLYDYTLDEAEQLLNSKLGPNVSLPEHQRIALVSMVFNGPATVGPKIIGGVRNGDVKAVIDSILATTKTSVPGVRTGLMRRRYAEAALFAGAANAHLLPPIEEYLART